MQQRRKDAVAMGAAGQIGTGGTRLLRKGKRLEVPTAVGSGRMEREPECWIAVNLLAGESECGF